MSQFYEDMIEWKQARRKSGLRGGPAYGERPLIWFDQIFQADIAPGGEVVCAQPLRVGSTQNSLDVVLVASPANMGNLTVASGATITLSLMQGDREDGDFEEVGPTICVKAGPDGMVVEPDELVCRFALGNFKKPWLMVKLEFAGSISGGLVDCALGYVPR